MATLGRALSKYVSHRALGAVLKVQIDAMNDYQIYLGNLPTIFGRFFDEVIAETIVDTKDAVANAADNATPALIAMGVILALILALKVT